MFRLILNLIGLILPILFTLVLFLVNPILGVLSFLFLIVVPGLTVFITYKKNKKK